MEMKNRSHKGGHLGFLEGRGPNFRKRANHYKTKKKLEAIKLGTHMIVDKKSFSRK